MRRLTTREQGLPWPQEALREVVPATTPAMQHDVFCHLGACKGLRQSYYPGAAMDTRNARLDCPGTGARFAETNWGLVLAARDTFSPAAEQALANLCDCYWYPIYAFLRRKGAQRAEAQDLTQGFFAHVLRREWLRNVGPEKGRFRTFVLRCLTNFVINQPRQPATIRIDFAEAEDRYCVEPVDHLTPARLFDMRWAVALLDRAIARLRQEYGAQGAEDRLEILLPFLSRETATETYRQLAEKLQSTEDAARQEVSRLRKRYRQAIHEEIAQTVSGPQEIDAELQYLLSVLSS